MKNNSYTMNKLRLLSLLFLVQNTTTTIFALSFREPTSRRKLMFAMGGAVIGSTTRQTNSDAACLPGDLSPDCIGVYKVPIDEGVRPYVGTEEALRKFAPDLRYVPPVDSPKNYDEAVDILLAQREAVEDIENSVWKGRLEEAGVKVLNLLPQLQTAGPVAVSSVDSSDVIGEIRLEKALSQLQDVQGQWGSVDIMIGQGLRGELGVSAVAQLIVISEIKDGIRSLDDFINYVKR